MDKSKDMNRELILKTTINLYAHYGIKGVSMGQIAGALRISKKTLYAEFGSKEELLCDCLEYEKNRVVKILQSTETSINNPVETIIMMINNLFQYKFYFCPAFHKDILRFRKATVKIENSFGKLEERYNAYFEQGKQEGYFIPDNDYGTISYMLVELLSVIKSSNRSILVYTFLRGLCTDKGMDTIDKLMPTDMNKEIYNYN